MYLYAVPTRETILEWKVGHVSKLVFGKEVRFLRLHYDFIEECVDSPVELYNFESGVKRVTYLIAQVRKKVSGN